MIIPPLTSLPAITPPSAVGAAATDTAPSFAAELRGALDQMQQLQSNATTQVNQLVSGNSEDVHASMIAVEKADLSFGLMLQLRNKAVEAYQDVANMAF